MKSKIYATNVDPFSPDSSYAIEAELPNKCPRCNTAFASKPHATVFAASKSGMPTAYSIFFCPVCEQCFFVCYDVVGDYDEGIGILTDLYPCPETKTEFSSAIKSVSPDFVKIYNQAEQAENQNLHDICGIGYRKALEFLIKDYAISIHPDKQSQIESSFLGNCISTYIENEKIKTLAKASAWIGNDETHYIRKHDNYNVQDLKRFISTIVAFIDYELNYAEALDLLSSHQ